MRALATLLLMGLVVVGVAGAVWFAWLIVNLFAPLFLYILA